MSFLKDYIWQTGSNITSKAIEFLKVIYILHIIDRTLPQSPIEGRRNILVKFPIGNIDAFLSIKDKLQELLFWMTDDNWKIEFYYAQIVNSIVQSSLPFGYTANCTALWSGGLDALAGAYLHLSNNPEANILLVGSGRNNLIFNKQKNLAHELNGCFQRRVEYLKVPIQFTGESKNKYARTRGLIFTTIGLLASNCLNTNKLLVFENGIGAFNAPMPLNKFCGMSHSVHPKTLHDISDIFSRFVEEDFTVENPFLFYTKAQMCAKAKEQGCSNELLLATDSCDSHGRDKGFLQCGVCSSCLLRRVSLINSIGTDDKTYGLQTQNRSEGINKLESWAMLEEESNKYSEWYAKAYEISDSKDKFDERFNSLYATYRKEVINALPQIRQNEEIRSNREIKEEKKSIIQQGEQLCWI
jgi:7-cyano-7-deazaguanine synthase in queuosine biosynthesis